jgi:chemotaxis response regulator CheB
MSDHPIIAMACSAGGLDALTTVLAPLPVALTTARLIEPHP